MPITPLVLFSTGEKGKAPILNRPWNNALTGSGYLADGTDFAGWAKSVHTHIVADVTGLQAALDAKAAAGASYTLAQADARFAPIAVPVSSLTGTTLPASVVSSSLTGVGILASPHFTSPVVDSGGLTVTAGGITVTSGGLAVTGASTIVSGTGLTVRNASLDGVALGQANTQSWQIAGLSANTAFGLVNMNVTIGSGSVTTATPLLTGLQTWSASGVTFTAVDVNITDTASAAASLLLSLRAGGASKFTVRKDGFVTIANGATISAGGLTVTAGGLTVSAGGITLGTGTGITIGVRSILARTAVAGITSVVPRGGDVVNLAAGATGSIDNLVGFLFILGNGNETAIVKLVGYGGGAPVFVYNDGNFSAALGTAGKININGNATNQNYDVQNNLAAARVLNFVVIGS